MEYKVYTDGACSNNGRINANAGIGIYFGKNDDRNLSKKIEGKQSNNTAELLAIIETYSKIKSDLDNGKIITIVSDSEYAIKCATSYGEKMEKKDYMLKKDKEIPNKELVKIIYNLYKNEENIRWKHIRSHTGLKDEDSLGNEEADKLANLAIGINTSTVSENKIKKKLYLKVPFERKEEVKKLKGRWDPSKKKWYIFEDNEFKKKILELFPI